MQLSYLPATQNKRKHPPKRAAGYQSARVMQPTLPYAGLECVQLERKLRAMRVDDVLRWRGWRLEYLYQVRGDKHYRLYEGDHLRYVQNIPDWVPIRTIQRDMATVLYWRGWDADHVHLIEYGTRCGLTSYRLKLRKPHLLPDYETPKDRQRYEKRVAGLKATGGGRRFQQAFTFRPRRGSAVGQYLDR
jgi:hypothetical protein